MPSILFLMKYPLHRRENLKGKFDGQMEAARALGWDAYCIGWDERGMTLIGKDFGQTLCRNALAGVRGYNHTKIFIDLMKAARIAMRRMHFDALHLRYMPTFSGAPRTLRNLKAGGGKLIIEYPTFPIAQENDRFFLRRLAFLYADRVMLKIRPMVDLYTIIGQDCGGTFEGKPAINIFNGVNVSALPLHTPRAGQPDIRLLALASMSGWHGYDRIIRSLAGYRGDADVRIAFVGGDGDGSLAKWMLLAEEQNLLGRITFHGPRYGAELEAIIAESDLGIGSLAMFRYGLKQGITLKAREFMARGLPFLNAVVDYALPDGKKYFLKVPNDETPIDMAEIVAFVQKAKADPSRSAAMRAYAEQNLNWTSILAPVLERVKP
jgi:glycosyltransferase involved in cell wall biosynthesis